MRITAILVLLSVSIDVRAEETWFDALIHQKELAQTDHQPSNEAIPLPNFGRDKYTISLWIKTSSDGAIFAKCQPRGEWSRGGKCLFIAGGRVCYDIGWVGCLEGKRRVADGRWHHVAFRGGYPQEIYIDGQLDAEEDMENTDDVTTHVAKLGYGSTNFPEQTQKAFEGQIDDVRIYGRSLSGDEILAIYQSQQPPGGRGLLAYWPLDGDTRDTSGSLNHATANGTLRFVGGKFGKALEMSNGAHLIVPCGEGESPDAELFRKLKSRFADEKSLQEMDWEREDGIWGADWKQVDYPELAHRYARAAQEHLGLRPEKPFVVPPSGGRKRPPHSNPSSALPAEAGTTNGRALPTNNRRESVAQQIAKAAARTRTAADLKSVRGLYLQSRRYQQLLDNIAEYRLDRLRQAINSLYQGDARQKQMLDRLEALEGQAIRWQDGPPQGPALDSWQDAVAALRHDVVIRQNPLLDFDKLVFVKRYTYHSSHFYTDFIDGVGNFGGNLCILDLNTGEVTDLLPEMKDGIFGRFDLSFDAQKIVFDWKAAPREGFRLFEVNIDGTGLKQLTFRPDDEDDRIRKYDNSRNGGTARMYYHQTDDMHPCYLPDGGIAFTSTRCEYGTLCDAPDHLSTAVLHRIEGDGSNLQRLTNSAVSEFSPSVMEDGWILYTRWEYVDKGQLGVKCLWAMRPDGTGSKEIYGNDIQYPPTMLHGRQIPGHSHLFVMLGTPHYPQSGIGTVIRIDTSKNIRTRDPMTYITPHVDIRQEPGWNHLVDGKWVRHTNGPLYMDPYPLSESVFLVAHNPDKPWNDMRAYGLYLIDEAGNHQLIHKDAEFSCWQPTPLRPRKKPPVQPTVCDADLAKKNLAACMVYDVHHGMEGIEPGEVKWLRVMEQLPRPWACRRTWDDTGHTNLISTGSALAAKVLYGVVPVYEDGSAHFLVPADRNIYLEALDENFMELQRERTYVNYRPGEKRSCIGCHESPRETPAFGANNPIATTKRPTLPQPQPGDRTAARPLHYPTDVQPVLDQHCVRCHGASRPAAGLDLTGELTRHFSRSYENIMRRRLVKTFNEGSDWDGTPYAPPKSVGSHASRLITQVREGCPGNDQELPLEAFVKLTTWVDANAVYYGSYWGRRDLRYKTHPNFRPSPTLAEALSTVAPLPEDER